MIREARQDDFDSILDLCGEFWTHTVFDEEFEPEHCVQMIQLAYDHGLLAVLEIDGLVVGFVAGVKSFLLGSNKAMYGTELAWWVKPEYRGGRNGINLLKFIEELAKSQGVKYWCMISMQSSMPDKVNRMYEKMGYSLSEMTYLKVV